MVFICNGFSCAVMHLAVFMCSTVPFFVHCKIIDSDIAKTAKEIDKLEGVSFDDCLAAIDGHPTAQRHTVTNGIWLCMESRGLAAAIMVAYENPRSPDVRAYLPFIATMILRQDWKRGCDAGRHRNVAARPANDDAAFVDMFIERFI